MVLGDREVVVITGTGRSMSTVRVRVRSASESRGTAGTAGIAEYPNANIWPVSGSTFGWAVNRWPATTEVRRADRREVDVSTVGGPASHRRGSHRRGAPHGCWRRQPAPHRRRGPARGRRRSPCRRPTNGQQLAPPPSPGCGSNGCDSAPVRPTARARGSCRRRRTGGTGRTGRTAGSVRAQEGALQLRRDLAGRLEVDRVDLVLNHACTPLQVGLDVRSWAMLSVRPPVASRWCPRPHDFTTLAAGGGRPTREALAMGKATQHCRCGDGSDRAGHRSARGVRFRRRNSRPHGRDEHDREGAAPRRRAPPRPPSRQVVGCPMTSHRAVQRRPTRRATRRSAAGCPPRSPTASCWSRRRPPSATKDLDHAGTRGLPDLRPRRGRRGRTRGTGPARDPQRRRRRAARVRGRSG